MSEEIMTTQDTINNAKNVEQIRDIIFGSQIKIFDNKLHHLNEKINKIESKFTQMLQDSHLKLKIETERSVTRLEEALHLLEDTIQQERLKEKEQIHRRDVSLQKQLKAQNELFLRKFQQTKESIEEDKRVQNENLYHLQSKMQGEIESVLSTLSQEKLSSASMSEMFLDIAMRLQGSSISEVLDKGIETGK